MDKENFLKIRLITSTFLSLCLLYIENKYSLSYISLFLLYLIPYLLISYDILSKAIRQLLSGKFFSISFLMSIATITALFIGLFPGLENEFAEAVFVMIFYQLGEMLEEAGEEKSKNAIKHLVDLSPELCSIEVEGKIQTIRTEEAKVGDIAIIRAGDKIGFDGYIIEGKSSLNTMALTGESMYKDVQVGDKVLSGCVNINGLLKIKVEKIATESTMAKILKLIEHSNDKKSNSERFIDSFAKIYTPFVVISAILLSCIPPLFGENSYSQDFPIWLQRSLSFLVASCPCALVISIPLSFFGGIGAASQHGILVKGSVFLEKLSKLKTVIFDKTGTLTQGKFRVTQVNPSSGFSKEELLKLAHYTEKLSTHPIAQSIKEAYKAFGEEYHVSDVTEFAGLGISAQINNDTLSVGNQNFMNKLKVDLPPTTNSHSNIVHIAVNYKYAGNIIIEDSLKEDSLIAIEDLKKLGIKDIHLLSGDTHSSTENVAKQLSIHNFKAELLPQDKLAEVQKLIQQLSPQSSLAFIGDGINDAPVISLAHIGIAMGALGSDAAIEAADIVILDDKVSKLAKLIKIARKSVSIAKFNIAFAISVKILVLILASLGFAPMFLAVFADVGVTVLAVLNSLRSIYTN